jgi:hypothetical protein
LFDKVERMRPWQAAVPGTIGGMDAAD